MSPREHVRTLLGPLLMACVLFVAAAAHLGDDPRAVLIVVLFYAVLWCMAPRVATVMAILTWAFTLGNLIGRMVWW